jgi:hypothetical protein
MRCRPVFHPLIIAATAFAMATAACGESPTTESAQESPAPTATVDLDRFLIRAGELAGFSPAGEPDTLSPLSAFVDEFHLPKAEEQRLRDHGFQSFVAEMLTGPSDAAGVSNVSLFSTKDGAARELEYRQSNVDTNSGGAKNFKRFDVPGVPTATGWTYDKPGGSKAADVDWSQGRCVMVLGSEPPSIDRLRTGVKAIYERTEGRCP